MRKILIRADASPEIGSGHLMRCLALAQEFSSRGWGVYLRTACTGGKVAARYEAEGYHAVLHDDPPGSEEDLKNTLRMKNEMAPDFLVLDGYAFAGRFQQSCHSEAYKTLVVDDYGHLDFYFCDYLLNPNSDAEKIAYARLSGPGMKMLGKDYALLRNEFLKQGPQPAGRGPIRKVLLTLGGGDAEGMTLKIADLLLENDFDGIEFLILAGFMNPHVKAIQEKAALSGRAVRVETDSRRVAEWFSWADLTISGSGSTVWELCYLRRPFLVLILADNQRAIAESLERRGMSRVLGAWDHFDSAHFFRTLTQTLKAPAEIRTSAEQASRFIDGLGRKRVVDTLLGGKQI